MVLISVNSFPAGEGQMRAVLHQLSVRGSRWVRAWVQEDPGFAALVDEQTGFNDSRFRFNVCVVCSDMGWSPLCMFVFPLLLNDGDL